MDGTCELWVARLCLRSIPSTSAVLTRRGIALLTRGIPMALSKKRTLLFSNRASPQEASSRYGRGETQARSCHKPSMRGLRQGLWLPGAPLFLFLLLLLCFSPTVRGSGSQSWWVQNWNYGSSSGGPATWGALYPTCKQTPNSMQSPIDITHATPLDSLVTPLFVTNGNGCLSWTQLNTLDDITIDLTQPGATCTNLYLQYEGFNWVLQELRFKSPSEHTVAGGHFDVEAQMIHQNPSNGHIAIVSVFLNVHDTPSNKNNSFLNTLWTSGPNLPAPSQTIVTAKILTDDFSPYLDLLPGSQNHFQYMGSLTEPPCTEDVDWIIFKDVVTMSSDDLRMIRSVQRTKQNYLSATGGNNRPLQSGYASVQAPINVKYTDGTTIYSPASTSFGASVAAALTAQNLAIAAIVFSLLSFVLVLTAFHTMHGHAKASALENKKKKGEDVEAVPQREHPTRRQAAIKAAGGGGSHATTHAATAATSKKKVAKKHKSINVEDDGDVINPLVLVL